MYVPMTPAMLDALRGLGGAAFSHGAPAFEVFWISGHRAIRRDARVVIGQPEVLARVGVATDYFVANLRSRVADPDSMAEEVAARIATIETGEVPELNQALTTRMEFLGVDGWRTTFPRTR